MGGWRRGELYGSVGFKPKGAPLIRLCSGGGSCSFNSAREGEASNMLAYLFFHACGPPPATVQSADGDERAAAAAALYSMEFHCCSTSHGTLIALLLTFGLVDFLWCVVGRSRRREN